MTDNQWDFICEICEMLEIDRPLRGISSKEASEWIKEYLPLHNELTKGQ